MKVRQVIRGLVPLLVAGKIFSGGEANAAVKEHKPSILPLRTPLEQLTQTPEEVTSQLKKVVKDTSTTAVCQNESGNVLNSIFVPRNSIEEVLLGNENSKTDGEIDQFVGEIDYCKKKGGTPYYIFQNGEKKEEIKILSGVQIAKRASEKF